MKHVSACACVALLLSACGGEDGDGAGSADAAAADAAAADAAIGDVSAPVFAGVESATVIGVDAVRLRWTLAADDSTPIRYEVYAAARAGGQDFAAEPLAAVSDAAEATVSGLATDPGVQHFFVVRARDAAGNRDDNVVERSASFTPPGLTFIAHLPMPGASSDVAVHASRPLVAVGGLTTGDTYIIDVSIPSEPVLTATIQDTGYQGDLEFKGDLLYVSHEFRVDSAGIIIYDLTDPSAPQVVNQVRPGVGQPSGIGHCHNITIHEDREIMYCASSQDDQLHIFSTGLPGLGGSPTAPAYLTSLAAPPGGAGVHDSYGRGDRVYVSYLNRGFTIYDVTDPTSPTVIGSKNYSQSFTHNAWPTADDRFVMTSDEVRNTNTDGMRVWDLDDPANITQVASFETANTAAIIHNVEIEGDHAFLSYYVDGLQVLDISEPTAPMLVASYDTFKGADNEGFDGAFGVQPKLPFVYISDISNGLFIFTFSP